MYSTFNVQRASVSGLITANLGGTHSAFRVPGAAPGSNSPPLSGNNNATSADSQFLPNGLQHSHLLTTLQAAQTSLTQIPIASSDGNGGVGIKAVGTVLPLISPPKIITQQQLSPVERPIKSSPIGSVSSNSTSATDGIATGMCSICSDRATGKHYGANSCDGCKGFFRRTIRKNQTYACRFNRNCVIDKDKRNTCRYCRFRKCLLAGMRKGAVQNERDRISVKRVKSETPPDNGSPGVNANIVNHANVNALNGVQKYSTSDTISFLLHAESVASQIRASVITSTSSSAGNAVPPSTEPQFSGAPRLANINDLSEAIKQQLLLLVEWAKLLPPFFDLPLDDQVVLLRAYAAQHLLLGVARRSLPYKDVLLLGNDAWIPRSHSSEIHDVNHVVLRLLDELVQPMREIDLDDTEYACVKALLFFSPSAYGLCTKDKVKETRQQVLEALQTYANQKQIDDIVRFGNILLLLPPLQAMSQQFIEDLQLATLFGMARFDKLLEELLLAAAEPLSAPFLVDGISAVANKMAGGLMGLVGANNGHDHNASNEREILTEIKNDDEQSTMIVDVVSCSNEQSPTNATNF